MATQTPSWFSDSVYLANKLVQLQSSDPSGGWTAEKLAAELVKYNATPYQHFRAIGDSENVSPNAYFNVSQYLKAKANQMNAEKYEGKTDWVESTVLAEMGKYGVSAWDHYLKVGQFEGVNPSNGLDTDAYFAAKVSALNSAAWGGRTDWKVADVKQIFKDAGCSPITDPTPNVTVVVVPADKQVSTTYNPYSPSITGSTFDLTTKVDTVNGTVNNDVVNGVASSLSSEGTLNPGDQIDGLAGVDTLNVKMNANFTGFTGDGKMVNVENVVLTNEGTIARTFSGKGSTGVQTYTLKSADAAINLSDLAAAGVTVNVDGLKAGAVTVGFTADAIKGTSDAMTLGLSNVGTAKTDAAPAKYVTPTATGIENLTVSASGNSYVDLSAAATKTITVNGSGTLDVSKVAATVTSVDASVMPGKITADLSGATLSTLKGGNGDDSFTVTSLAPTATLAGGTGSDTLTIVGLAGTLQPTMSGFETVKVQGTGVGTSLTFSGKNVKDFSGLEISNNATVVLANVDSPAFAIAAKGTNTGGVTLASPTVLTYNTVADDTAVKTKTTVSVAANITASEATSATVNVGAYTSLDGIVEVTKATDVTVNVASGFDTTGKNEQTSFAGTLNASNAASLVVKADGLLGNSTYNVANASSVNINAAQGSAAAVAVKAAKATSVDITSGAALTLTGSTFGAAESVHFVQSKGALTAGTVDFAKLNTLTVSGGDGTSSMVLGSLGSVSQDYGITVNASELKTGLTIADIDTKGDVNLNFAGVTGTATVTAANGLTGNNVTVHAAQLGLTKIGAIIATGDVVIDGLGILGSGTALDLGAISATGKTVNIQFDGSSAVTLGALAGKTVSLDASNYLSTFTHSTIAADTVTVKGSAIASNDFNAGGAVTADNLTFIGGLDVDSLKLTGKTTTGAVSMNLSVDTGMGSDTVVVTAASTDAVTKMVGTISNAETVTVAAAAGGLDMRGLTISGNNTATITGAAGDDILKATKGVDAITLGTGADKVIIGAGDSGITVATADTIAGFTTADDKLVLGFTGSATTVKINAAAVGVDFATALATAKTDINGTIVASFSAVTGGDGFLFQDTNGDGTVDQAVILTGVTAIAAGDIVASA